MRTMALWMIVFLPGLCAGQAPTQLPVSGQVVDYLARPVQGAEVVVYEREYVSGSDYDVKTVGPIVKTAEDGRFKLEIESLSQYNTFIVARKPGLAMAWDGLNYSSNTLSQGVFLLVLQKSCTQTGRVVDHWGQPVIGATVQVLPKTSYMDRLSQRPMFGPEDWFTCQTDDKGVFQFTDLSADVKSDFRVTAKGSQCTQTFTTHTQNCCGFEIDRPEIDLVLGQTYPVRGRVVDNDNLPVAGVAVQIQYKRESEHIMNRYRPMHATTNAQGEFDFQNVPEGENQIQLATSDEIIAEWVARPRFVTSGRLNHDDVIMKVEKGGVLDVLVRNAATEAAVSDVTVSVGIIRATTDEQGRARVRVLSGEHDISVWGLGYSSARTHEPVQVNTGETTTKTMLLDQDKTSHLTGQVHDEQGAVVPGVMVVAHPFGDRVSTDGLGRFECSFELERSKAGLYVVARDIRRSMAAILHTKVFEEPISLLLAPALTVKGKVVDPAGTGIPAARVSLCFSYSSCLSSFGNETLTDAQGQFEIRAVPQVGKDFSYRISVHASGFAPKTYSRVTIEGEPGQVAQIDPVVLKPANLSISGVVVDANGVPAPRVIMFLRGDNFTDQPDKATATDEQGRFRYSGIAEGPLRIQLNFSNSPAGNGTLKCQAGDQGVKGILGQTVVHESYRTLKGKALPDLAHLSVDLIDMNVSHKPVVLIFWDMEQRPSRRAVTQLAKQREILEAKGISVIAIDVSGVAPVDLKAWKKDYDIPFLVTPIKGDFEELKLTWGVKALPWLILTDEDHRVEADGLSVEEVVGEM